MNSLRIIMVIVIVALASAGMGQIGCGGGVIPFGGEKAGEGLGITAPAAEDGSPLAPAVTPGEVSTPVVTEQKESPPPERSGIPCLMNYALALDPEYILVIKSNEAILNIMGLIDFDLFSLVLDDPSIVDDLLGYADELVIAGGSQGTVALVRIKSTIIESGKDEKDFGGLFDKLKIVIRQALAKHAAETGTPVSETEVIYSSFTNDPSAYVVGLSSTLAKLVNQTAEVDCNYCTIGACGTQNVPMLYLSIQGATFYNWLVEVFGDDRTSTADTLTHLSSKEVKDPFGSARFVMGIDVDAKKAATAYAALFDSTACTQDSLLAAISAYLNVTKGFGQRLLNAILSGVLQSTSTPEVTEVGSETGCESDPQVAALLQQIDDLELQIQQALALNNEARAREIRDEVARLTTQLDDLLAQKGCPPLAQEGGVATESATPPASSKVLADLEALCAEYDATTDAGTRDKLMQNIQYLMSENGITGSCGNFTQSEQGVPSDELTTLVQLCMDYNSLGTSEKVEALSEIARIIDEYGVAGQYAECAQAEADLQGEPSTEGSGSRLPTVPTKTLPQNLQIERLRTLSPLIKQAPSGSDSGDSGSRIIQKR